MVAHPTTPYPDLGALTGRLDEVSRAEHNRYVDAAALATGLFGDTTTANVLLLGVAVQQGAIAVDPAHIERAIELNGVAVDRNVAAFRWGRRWAATPPRSSRPPASPRAGAGDDRRARSTASPTTSSATRTSATPSASSTSSTSPARPSSAVDPASTAFTEAVARYGHKLMAYKDEYEVARLLLAPEARAAYEAVGGPAPR